MGLGDVAAACRAAAAAAEDAPYVSGTFTVQNLGAFGVTSAAPVVHAPQACALALGAVTEGLKPGAEPGSYVSAPSLTATLAADHRVVDGAVGAQWRVEACGFPRRASSVPFRLAALKALVETPTKLLL